ncbi:MAG: multiheme c-type cytochrome [Acidobacteriaceae bacterium]
MATFPAFAPLLRKVLFWLMTLGALAPVLRAQLSTADHLQDPGFWPTRPGVSRADYTGPGACRQCHAEKFTEQAKTAMRRTAFSANLSLPLHEHPKLTFDVGPYHYLIESDAQHSLYTVTDGRQTLSSPLLWAFGTPRIGQSYLFKRADGHFYEARVTYFKTINRLGFTPSRDLLHPKDVEQAMDRMVPPSEVKQCFSCHTTAAVIGDQFDEQHLIPGVTCEACHGPGAKHVADMKALMKGDLRAAQNDDIFNSAHLLPNDAVDFCGACHGTWWDVKLSGTTGPSTVRSAPARLVESKCWGQTGDARLVCTSCHDPHQPLNTNEASYDHACLQCHNTVIGAALTEDHPGKACPVAKSDCASCHMPKVYVKEMHDYFTDHRIRIARAGEPFPE